MQILFSALDRSLASLVFKSSWEAVSWFSPIVGMPNLIQRKVQMPRSKLKNGFCDFKAVQPTISEFSCIQFYL